MNDGRTSYFKAATTTLTGPHYGGLTYVPGSEHQIPLHVLDPDPDNWCAAGLYFTSHRRVAARWGPVVLNVEVPRDAPKVKTTKTHRPVGVPDGVDSGTYAKYRTTRMRVLGVVGVVGFGWGIDGSRDQAMENFHALNSRLDSLGFRRVVWLGQAIERLRNDGYQLWAVSDPNAVSPIYGGRSAVQAPQRKAVSATVTFATYADPTLVLEEIYTKLGTVRGVEPGSQRVALNI